MKILSKILCRWGWHNWETGLSSRSCKQCNKHQGLYATHFEDKPGRPVIAAFEWKDEESEGY